MKMNMIRFIKVGLVACAILTLPTTLTAAPSLGKVKSVKTESGRVTIKSNNGTLYLTPYAQNIVKVTTIYNGENDTIPTSRSAVLVPSAKFDVKQSGSNISINLGGNNKVVVDKKSSLIRFDFNGKTLLTEKGGIVDEGKEQTVTFNATSNESFYGAGERGQSVDLRGDTLVMFNKQNYGYGKGDRTKQMNITVPFFISSKGYGVLFDDYTSSKLILNESIEYITNNRYPISYYFIAGEDENIASVVKDYTLLTGRQDLAPFWSLGYITSKYGYKTQDETLAVVDTLKQNGYPVDGIVLDLFWYGQETDMGRFEWNKEQWPDHKKMLADLKAKGVKTVIISQPYLNKIGAIDNYNMGKANNLLAKDSLGNVHDVTTWVGEAGMLDVSNPKTRDWMWSRYKELTDEGVTGWWGDLGEPEVHPLTIRHANGETAAEYHNQYGNDWSEIIYSGFKKEYPNTRLMTLMRGGTAGLQRFSVFPWSTDVSRSWGGLQAQIPIMLNTAMSGLGYMSHDVGGFAVDPKNPTDDELYARWLQLGLFTPILRTHSTVAAEPYHYNKPGYQDLFKSLIKARYQWLPYNYTLAYENAKFGYPFVRPLNFYDSQEASLSNIEDEYLWGKDILVAPVLESGVIARKVILPEGVWYDYNDPSEKFVGPGTITYPAPITTIPVFVRAGSFIPLADYGMESTENYDPSKYTVWYYPTEGKSSYTLFTDDMKSTNSLETQSYKLINFEADNNPESLSIDIKSEGKGYLGMPNSVTVKFVIPDFSTAPKSVIVNGKVLNSTEMLENQPGYQYDSANKKLTLRVQYDFNDLVVKIRK